MNKIKKRWKTKINCDELRKKYYYFNFVCYIDENLPKASWIDIFLCFLGLPFMIFIKLKYVLSGKI